MGLELGIRELLRTTLLGWLKGEDGSPELESGWLGVIARADEGSRLASIVHVVTAGRGGPRRNRS